MKIKKHQSCIKIGAFYVKKNFVQKLHGIFCEILYIDPKKKRINNRLARTGLQLPFLPTTYDPINKITYIMPSVNSNSMQKAENNTKKPENNSQNEKASIPGTRVADIEARKNVGGLEAENNKREWFAKINDFTSVYSKTDEKGV